MGKLIEITGLEKRYGELEVLKRLDMRVDTGEVVAIIGASGSGKSTLARCIAGLEPINGGRILFDGQAVKRAGAAHGKIGMVFQNFNLFPHYKVKDNLGKPLKAVRNMKRDEIEARIAALLEKVHLADKADQYPGNLSGGQQQRVAIARALAMEPQLIVFDEPTSSLDPELAHEVFETISQLAREGQTMLIVTHQINAARNFATRMVFLYEGKIAADGTPGYIINRCDHPQLKKFLEQVDFADL